MDAIQDYGSDSGSNLSASEETNEDSNQCSEKTKNINFSDESDKNLTSKSHSTEKHQDFFNLSVKSSCSTTYIKSPSTEMPAKQIIKDEKFHTPFGDVEVPSSDFWTDFVPLENSDESSLRTSHDHYFKRQTLSSSSTDPLRNASISNAAKTNVGANFVDQHEYGTEFQKFAPKRNHNGDVMTKSKLSLNSTNSDSPVNHSEQTIHACVPAEKRKIFYIHSKISPYLYNAQVCRLSCRLVNCWSAHDSVINRIAWNESSFSHLLLTAGMDTQVRVWSAWSSLDRCVTTLSGHTKAVRHAEWTQSGRAILSCSYDRTAQVTDVETGQVQAECEHAGFVTCGRRHCSNPSLFATGTDNMILVWDVRTPQAPVKHFSHKESFGQVQDLLFIAEGHELVSCSDLVSRDSADKGIMAWDFRSGVVLSNQIFQERYTCTRLKLHPEKSYFLAQTHGDYIAQFSTSRPYKLDKSKRFESHELQGYHIGFDLSPDGKLVYSGSAHGGMHCYDYQTGRSIRKLSSSQGQGQVIMDVTCHPVMSSVVASCTWGGRVVLWQ